MADAPPATPHPSADGTEGMTDAEYAVNVAMERALRGQAEALLAQANAYSRALGHEEKMVATKVDEPAAKGKKAKKVKDPNAPKRPPTGYQLFSAHKRKKKGDEMPKGKAGMTYIAGKWQEIGEEGKKKWQGKAEDGQKHISFDASVDGSEKTSEKKKKKKAKKDAPPPPPPKADSSSDESSSSSSESDSDSDSD
ncbi:hypothetical protein JL720_10764 [Aureococcus anophagefferens]|nr:hypothetical protein JL720_10764 [Aureococcus anophagefferens]